MLNPYEHKRIKTPWDTRLVDCFVKQNPSNDYLFPRDVAAWIYETNNPDEEQINAAYLQMMDIIGMTNTADRRLTFLEKGTQNEGNKEYYVFRLLYPELVDAPLTFSSVEFQMTEALEQSIATTEAKKACQPTLHYDPFEDF